jgi:hypothetical protein
MSGLAAAAAMIEGPLRDFSAPGRWPLVDPERFCYGLLWGTDVYYAMPKFPTLLVIRGYGFSRDRKVVRLSADVRGGLQQWPT